MLLIDDHQGQPRESNFSGQERMRSDGDGGFSGCYLLQGGPSFDRGHSPHKEDDFDTHCRYEILDVCHMLVSQDFRGRHNCHLKTFRYGHQGGEQSDDGLPGTNLTVQKPIHRVGLFHVGDDLFERSMLCVGQIEWQSGNQSASQVFRSGGHKPGLKPPPSPFHSERNLHQKELIERQTSSSLPGLIFFVRKMDTTQSFGQPHQSRFRQDPLGERFRNLGDKSF